MSPFSIQEYTRELTGSLIVVVSSIVAWVISKRIVKEFSKKANISKSRAFMVLKLFGYLITALAAVSLISVWGVEKKQLFLVISSVLTVIGVAFFAQWSVLSNITAGIILFFTYPFRIGDKIKILDKEFPIEAQIKDIKSFYTLLEAPSGEQISLPNNILLQKTIMQIKEFSV